MVLPWPTAWTLLGLVFALSAALLYSFGPGHGAFGAGLLLLLSGALDSVDGAVARALGRVSPRGAFLDSTLDRVSEAAVYLGIIAGGYMDPYPAVGAGALAFSLLVSYTRAKGDSLGVNLAGVGIGERSERLLVLIVASLAGVVAWGVIAVVVLSAVTFVQRTVRVARNLGGARQAVVQPLPVP